MICEDCGMRNTSRKCTLCGHVSSGKRRVTPKNEEEIFEPTREVKSELHEPIYELEVSTTEDCVDGMTSTIGDIASPSMINECENYRREPEEEYEPSKLNVPKELKKNRAFEALNKFIIFIVIIILFTNFSQVLLFVAPDSALEWFESEVIREDVEESVMMDIEDTGFYEHSSLLVEWVADYAPTLVESEGSVDFEIPLFELGHNVPVKLTCYNEKWYELSINLYDIASDEVDTYLMDFFSEYTGEEPVYDEEYNLYQWLVEDEIEIEAYRSKDYETGKGHIMNIYIENENYWNLSN